MIGFVAKLAKVDHAVCALPDWAQNVVLINLARPIG